MSAVPRHVLVVRVLKMHALLCRRAWSVQEIARELDTHRRTVYRDLAALQEAHVPIVEETEGRTRRYRAMA